VADAHARQPAAHDTGRQARRWMWATLAATVLALLLVVALATPWSPWPGAATLRPDPARDFTERQIAAANRFHAAVRPPFYTGLVVSVAVSIALGITPLGARLVRTVGRRLRGLVAQVTAGTVAVSALALLAAVPFAAWAHVVLVRYGLSTQSWGAWLIDVAKGWAVATALSAGALVALVGLARRLPRWWFGPAALVAGALVGLGSFLHPVVIEPVFNSFAAMKAGPLRTSLLDLAERDGIAVEDVLVADASRRTTTLNAYVSGFGATRRIVIYDTLLAQATAAEVRLIVAHELGHVRASDVARGTATGALGAAAGVTALALALTSPAVLRRVGVRSAGDPAVVAAVLALYSLGSLLSLPVQNLVSRQVEARADLHALDLTGDPETFTALQRTLAIANRTDLDPPALHYWWFASHPSPPARIAIASRWAAQVHSATGEALRAP